MQSVARVAVEIPPRWEIEQWVVEIACEETDVPRGSISSRSRLIEDLHMDSLALVEFIMEIEEVFLITIPDGLWRAPFVNPPVTLATAADFVIRQWGTGEPDRSRWRCPRETMPEVESVPPTQFDGRCTLDEWLDGQLHGPLGPLVSIGAASRSAISLFVSEVV